MKVLVNLSGKSFTLDGVPHTKRYEMRLGISGKVSVVSIYDRADVLMNEVSFEDISIDGETFGSVEELMLAFEDLKANFNMGGETPIYSNQYNTNAITFKNTIGDYFGKVTTPRTGALTFDTTDAITGGISVVYYQDATLQMPNVWRTIGTFAPNELNKIYLERDSEGYITCNIVPPVLSSEPTATAPTITVTNP